jgi:hypothetical protein
MKIITNNKPRFLISGYELPDNIKECFDYIDPIDFDMHDFVLYKGQYYDIHQFMKTDDISEFEGWQGYISDTVFSGVLIKIVDDDRVIMATYIC